MNLDSSTGTVEALIVFGRGIRVQGEPPIADEIEALGRVSNNEDVEPSVMDRWANRVDSRASVRSGSRQESESWPELIEQAAPI